MSIASELTPADEDGVASLLASVARGDTDAFSRLYDRLALATYAVCLLTTLAHRESAMLKTWLFVWTNAASLSTLPAPARSTILEIAREMARSDSPAAR